MYLEIDMKYCGYFKLIIILIHIRAFGVRNW